jgi:hypothetical protein
VVAQVKLRHERTIESLQLVAPLTVPKKWDDIIERQGQWFESYLDIARGSMPTTTRIFDRVRRSGQSADLR